MDTQICALMQQGKWDEAEKAARSWVMAQPANAKAQAMLGLCHYHFARFDAAAECFKTSIALDPHFADAGFKLCECFDRLQEYEKALGVAQEFRAQNPNDVRFERFAKAMQQHVPEKITDSWQLTAKPQHNVSLSQD